MKTKPIIVGVDVSKATLDICVLGEKPKSYCIANTVKSIQAFFKRQKTAMKVCMENTGRYNWAMYQALKDLSGVDMYVVSPLHMNKSLGLARGKDDKVDALRIARYIEKHHKDLSVWSAPSSAIDQLKVLLAERKQRIRMRSKLQVWAKEYDLLKDLSLDASLADQNKEFTALLNKQIKELEQQMELVIKADEQLHGQSQLIRSVPGVGKVLCWMLLAKTNGFTMLCSPRQLACYAGVAPFPYSSGTSIRGKERVSGFADKSLKTVLHMGAMRAVTLDKDLHDYYMRKTQAGKNKMLVLNAVRNKLIHRICAVINNQKMYQPNLLLS